MWCALANKILSWDKMIKYSLEGSGWCTLCKNGDENITHLFISCPFTIQIWNYSKSLLNMNLAWHGQNMEETWKTWLNSPIMERFHALSLLLIWVIWLDINKAIF